MDETLYILQVTLSDIQLQRLLLIFYYSIISAKYLFFKSTKKSNYNKHQNVLILQAILFILTIFVFRNYINMRRPVKKKIGKRWYNKYNNKNHL